MSVLETPLFEVQPSTPTALDVEEMGVWNWIRPLPTSKSKAAPKPLKKSTVEVQTQELAKGKPRKDSRDLERKLGEEPLTNRHGHAPQEALQDQEQELPSSQTVLLLNEIKTPYTLTPSYPLPSRTKDDEVVIKTQVIGLNPIDWKAP